MIPYRNESPSRKRRTLDQNQVVRAALALLDEEGMDELTMRRLADRLGVKAPSLYRHVRDKQDLLILLADEISGEIPLPRGPGGWRVQLSEMARNVRQGLAAHRDAARVLASTPPAGPRRLRHIEAVLRILRSAGLGARDAVRAAHLCNNFVTEFAADEARFAAIAATSGGRRKMFAEARGYFRQLPVKEFPNIVELADDLSDDDADGLFQFGIETLLHGLERLTKDEARSSGRPSKKGRSTRPRA